MSQSKPDADPKLTRRQAENIRSNIANKASRYVEILTDHIEGRKELKPTQVKSAQVLLSKVLPDEQRIEQTQGESPDLTPEQLEESLADVLQEMAEKDPERFRKLLRNEGMVLN